MLRKPIASAKRPNPFHYCGEYFDSETGTVYLRNRNYDTATGRFSSEDTHWNAENRIYGDNPQRINEEPERFKYAKTVVGNEEKERGKGALLPNVSAIRQSGNLYEYGMGNPVSFGDATGDIAFLLVTALIGAAVGAVVGAAISASKGEEWWKGALAGAAIGGLAGLTLGAATGAALAGSAVATTAQVVTGAGTIATAVGSGGVVAGGKIIYDNSSAAINQISNALWSHSPSAKSIVENVPDLQKTQTVMNNVTTRPYINSTLTIQQIVSSSRPVQDAFVNDALRWDVSGSFNGSKGFYELVINPKTNYVLHFLFRSQK